MSRVVIDLPANFDFTTSIPVRITDLNYGGHVGNDTILSIIHEGRIQFLQHHSYSEKNFAGVGMIMGDVSIVFKNEVFYGDTVQMSIAVSNLSKVSFDIVYKLTKQVEDKLIEVAHAKTGMVCFDYLKKKVVSLPDEVKSKFSPVW